MSFIWPVMLIALVVPPLLVWLYVRLQQRRRRLAAGYGSLGIVQATGRPLGWRRYVPPALFLVGLTLLALALARPQAVVSLPRLEGTVILTFDVSGSMAADDIKPTRMEAAKAAARQFVERQPSTVQIGVVSFSESGFSVQPPTNDQAEILAAIDRLAPARGTSLATGIQVALSTIATANGKETTGYYTRQTPMPTATPTPMPKGQYQPAAIILLTDGENNIPPNPLTAAKEAANRGVRIYTIGIGSPTGATLKIEGFTVQSRLDEAALKQIAALTDGAYYNAQNEQDLQRIYGNLGTQFVVKPQQTEVTSLFAGASLLVLLLGGVFSLLWFSRVP